MNIKQNINSLLNAIKVRKKYIILPYTKKIYLIFLILRKFCIKSVYKFEKWILVYLVYNYLKRNLIIKTFNLKNKQNFYTFKQLKFIYKKNKYGIIFTSKGICSLEQAIKLKQGGILFCLIYFSN